MDYYENEIKALKKSGRYRTIEVLDYSLKDFASNDYLGLSHNKELHKDTCKELNKLEVHSTKASLLVNGYHQIHKDFIDTLCRANDFEDGVILGSGFNANIALIEALVRKGDTLFMDELYHASGVLASSLESVNVIFFKHNDMDELKSLLKNSNAKRKIVAVDVIGDKLMGIFDYYNIDIKPNHIKMGTLGKAYGSFGAYILASSHIVDYLINRAKPIIYATSLSLYDTLLAHNSLKYILENSEVLKSEISKRQDIVKDILGIKITGLIVKIHIGDNNKVIEMKNSLKNDGYSIGGIRQPTVPSAILRVIARLDESSDELRVLCQKIKRSV